MRSKIIGQRQEKAAYVRLHRFLLRVGAHHCLRSFYERLRSARWAIVERTWALFVVVRMKTILRNKRFQWYKILSPLLDYDIIVKMVASYELEDEKYRCIVKSDSWSGSDKPGSK